MTTLEAMKKVEKVVPEAEAGVGSIDQGSKNMEIDVFSVLDLDQ